MTPKKIDRYRGQLTDLAQRLQVTSQSLERASCSPTGGEAAGGLSNAPLHLGDMGSEVYTQELNSTLLENEEFIRQEVLTALDRIELGRFGLCESCGVTLPEGRLNALPYARYCVPCAEERQAGADVNLNAGRPAGWGSTLENPAVLAGQRRAGEQSPTTAPRSDNPQTPDDLHAAGTPGGGTVIGGLAGTNIDDGNPDGQELEEAMGSGTFDRSANADEEEGAYAGPSGGAVGGTPANKRATGGKRSGEISSRRTRTKKQ